MKYFSDWHKAQNNTQIPYRGLLEKFYFQTGVTQNDPEFVSVSLVCQSTDDGSLTLFLNYDQGGYVRVEWRWGNKTSKIGKFFSKAEDQWLIDQSLKIYLNEEAISDRLEIEEYRKVLKEIEIHLSKSAQCWFKAPRR